MRRHNISDFEERIVDGEKILFPTHSQWLSLFEGGAIEDALLFEPKVAKFEYDMLARRPGFRCGVSHQQGRETCLQIWFFSTGQSELQRVHLERLTCNQCGHKLWSAYHLEYSLYAHTSSATESWQKAWELPRVDCPICGAKLSRPSIFAFAEE